MNMKLYIQLLLNKKLLASSLLSFIWVSNYQYHYNVEIFNTRIINIWAFTLWVTSGYIYLNIYNNLKVKIYSKTISLFTCWCVYLSGLLMLEYIGYSLLGIHENSARGGALILGLIHGSTVLHIYYMFFPALIILLYQLLLMSPGRVTKWLQNFRQAPRRYTTWP